MCLCSFSHHLSSLSLSRHHSLSYSPPISTHQQPAFHPTSCLRSCSPCRHPIHRAFCRNRSLMYYPFLGYFISARVAVIARITDYM